MRIYNGICFAFLVNLFTLYIIKRHCMVVCYENCHSKLLCMGDFLNRCNSVVTGDHSVYPILISLVDQVHIQTIAILNSVWNHIVHTRTCSFKCLHKNICRHHSVYIIVADYPDFGLVSYLLGKNVNQPLTIL